METIANRVELADALTTGTLVDRVVQEMDARQMDWSNVRVHHCVFRNVAMDGVECRDATWSSVEVCNSTLRGIRVPTLENGVFRNCDLAESIWESSACEGTQFEQSPLANARMEDAVFRTVSFESCDLSHLRARNWSWYGGSAQNAELGGANLYGADLRQALVMNVDLQGANLGRTNAQNSLWIGVDLRGTEWTGTDLRGARFYGCRLEGSEGLEKPLTNCDLIEVLQSEALQDPQRLRGVLEVTLPRLRSQLSPSGTFRNSAVLPIPREYQTATYEEIVRALAMGLPHPEWRELAREGVQNASDGQGAHAAPGASRAESPTAEPTIGRQALESPNPQEDPKPESIGSPNRFSLLELD